MNKNFIFLYWALSFFLLGFSPITTKKELLFQAQEIKTASPLLSLQSSSPELCPLPELEKLIYKAKFLGLPIGKFVIMNNGKMMLNHREVHCFELTVKTLPFFNKIFRTKDRYVTYMDTEKFVVIRHEEYVRGGNFLESAVDFDYKNLTATHTNFVTQQESTITIPSNVLDVLSGGFYLRMIPLELGDIVDLNIYADGKIYNYTGLLTSKIRMSVPNHGKQDAYVFNPYLFLNGEQVKKISAEIFISALAPTKTIRAILTTRFGKVNVILVEGFETL